MRAIALAIFISGLSMSMAIDPPPDEGFSVVATVYLLSLVLFMCCLARGL